MRIAVKLRSATEYQRSTERVIRSYCRSVTPTAQDSRYIEVLRSNTNRIQGSLVLAGYDLEGGTDTSMIERAVLAIELLHAYAMCMEQGIDTEQALRAQHEAQIILANLEMDEENRLKALSITNRTLMLATLARLPGTSEEDALNWRATECTLNPLHVGQVLASADCHATNRVTPEAISYGKAILTQQDADLQRLLDNLAEIKN